MSTTLKLLPSDDYCLMAVSSELIVCSYFKNINYRHGHQVNFFAVSSSLLFNAICRHKKISSMISLSHSFYIGQEICKVELSKALSQRYVQL